MIPLIIHPQCIHITLRGTSFPRTHMVEQIILKQIKPKRYYITNIELSIQCTKNIYSIRCVVMIQYCTCVCFTQVDAIETYSSNTKCQNGEGHPCFPTLIKSPHVPLIFTQKINSDISLKTHPQSYSTHVWKMLVTYLSMGYLAPPIIASDTTISIACDFSVELLMVI